MERNRYNHPHLVVPSFANDMDVPQDTPKSFVIENNWRRPHRSIIPTLFLLCTPQQLPRQKSIRWLMKHKPIFVLANFSGVPESLKSGSTPEIYSVRWHRYPQTERKTYTCCCGRFKQGKVRKVLWQFLQSVQMSQYVNSCVSDCCERVGRVHVVEVRKKTRKMQVLSNHICSLFRFNSTISPMSRNF